jgi:UPF0716 protein FxsA
MPLLLLFIAVPLIEIGLFIQIGGAIGLWPTLAVVLITAVVGSTVLRRQGVGALNAIQAQVAAGRDPSAELAKGALLLLAALLLLTPGFFTDAVGLALLSPQARAAVVAWAGPKLAARTVVMGGGFVRRAGPGTGPRAGADDGPIDVEYRDVTDAPPPQGDTRR